MVKRICICIRFNLSIALDMDNVHSVFAHFYPSLSHFSLEQIIAIECSSFALEKGTFWNCQFSSETILEWLSGGWFFANVVSYIIYCVGFVHFFLFVDSMQFDRRVVDEYFFSIHRLPIKWIFLVAKQTDSIDLIKMMKWIFHSKIHMIRHIYIASNVWSSTVLTNRLLFHCWSWFHYRT